jgi:hypothetical protein
MNEHLNERGMAALQASFVMKERYGYDITY